MQVTLMEIAVKDWKAMDIVVEGVRQSSECVLNIFKTKLIITKTAHLERKSPQFWATTTLPSTDLP